MMNASVPLAFSASGALLTNYGFVTGYLVHETAGAAARVLIYDNASAASGTLIGAALLAANGVQHIVFPQGLRVANGIYVEVAAGAVTGHVAIG